MTDIRYQPTPPPVPAAAARVVLIGTPSPLRAAVARQMRARDALVACLDAPGQLAPAVSSGAIGAGRGLAGATVVFVTVPRPPGLATRLRHRLGAAAMTEGFEQAARAARRHGVRRIVVLSTVFCNDDDRGQGLDPGSPALVTAETAAAAAAEQAARVFTSLGGDSVALRLGWTWSRQEAITRRVLTAAKRGWRLIDGDPGAWVAMIAEPDAARAVWPAITVPPGGYNLTDGVPVTQAVLNAGLETALGRPLHSAYDPGWSAEGILFGPSRKVADRTFADLTGWHPHVVPAAGDITGALRRTLPGRRGSLRCLFPPLPGHRLAHGGSDLPAPPPDGARIFPDQDEYAHPVLHGEWEQLLHPLLRRASGEAVAGRAEGSGEVEQAAYLAWVAAGRDRGLVDGAVAVRQLAGHVGHPQSAGDPAVGLGARQPSHPGPGGGDPDRDVVGGLRAALGATYLVVLAVQAERAWCGNVPDAADDVNRLAERRHGLGRAAPGAPGGCDRVGREGIAGAEAQLDPA